MSTIASYGTRDRRTLNFLLGLSFVLLLASWLVLALN
jgi:hypothetical protein